MASMEFRGSLALPDIPFYLVNGQATQSKRSSIVSFRHSYPRLPSFGRTTSTKKSHSPSAPCYDWIFSSATNVHVAVDKSAFKTLVPFESYVLTVAGQKQVQVLGIGTVDIKVRCRENSRDGRLVSLEDVLYIPTWPCNIFSEIYFQPSQDYEHSWKADSIQFSKINNGKKKPWGYTEPFCALDKLVLQRKFHGRSPMLEDCEREVWTVNAHWPQGQRDKWEQFCAEKMRQIAEQLEAEILVQLHPPSTTKTISKRLSRLNTKSIEFLASSLTTPRTLKSASQPTTTKVFARTCTDLKSDPSGSHGSTHRVNSASLELAQAGARLSLSEVNQNISSYSTSNRAMGSLRGKFKQGQGSLRRMLSSKMTVSTGKENYLNAEV